MSSSKLDQLRNRLKQADTSSNSQPNNYYRFWDMKTGKNAVIRFLPDLNEENPLGFLVEKKSHQLTINGERRTVACLTQYGEDCPVCKTAKQYYDSGDTENGKKYYRKLQHIAQALVVEDPCEYQDESESCQGKVKLISISYQLFKIIKNSIEDGDLEEIPYEYKGGTNFIINKDMQGDYPSYILSKFARKETDLDDDTIEYVQNQLQDLSEVLPKNPGYEKIEAMLEADLNGGSYQDEAEVQRTSSSDTEASETNNSSIVDNTDSRVASSEDPDEILNAIRKRKNQEANN